MKRIRNRQLRTSRILLVLTGLVLVGGAAVALLLATGLVDRLGSALVADESVLNAEGMDLLGRNELAFQLAGVAGGLVAVLIGLWWLREQIPPMRHQEDSSIANDDQELTGRNVMSGDALATALRADVERSDAVERARTEMRTGDGLIRLRLDIDERASVSEVFASVVTPAVDRLCTVAELQAPPRVVCDVRPVERASREVS